MPGFSWKKIKEAELIKDTDKDRLLAIMLVCMENYKPSRAQLAVAAEEFGAAPGGFERMHQIMMKKLREADVYLEGEDEDERKEGAESKETPKQKAAAPKKRKAGSNGDENGSPAAKKRAPKKQLQIKEEEGIMQEVKAEDGVSHEEVLSRATSLST